jgi:hypothetical protein
LGGKLLNLRGKLLNLRGELMCQGALKTGQ